MKVIEEYVEQIYQEIADQLGITPDEVQARLVKGEALVQRYYEWKWNWDPKKDEAVPF